MKKSLTKMLAVGLCAAMVVLTGWGASETTGNTKAGEEIQKKMKKRIRHRVKRLRRRMVKRKKSR